MADPAHNISAAKSTVLSKKHASVQKRMVLSVVDGQVKTTNRPSLPIRHNVPASQKEKFPEVEGAYILLHPGVAPPAVIQVIREHDQVYYRGLDGSRASGYIEGQVFVGPINQEDDRLLVGEVDHQVAVPTSTSVEDRLEIELNDVYGKLDATEKELKTLKLEQVRNPLIEKNQALKVALKQTEDKIVELTQRASVSEDELEISIRENESLLKQVKEIKSELGLVKQSSKHAQESRGLTPEQTNALVKVKTLLMHTKIMSNTEQGRAAIQTLLDELS